MAGGVPATCGQTREYRVGRGSFVELKRLRIEFSGKALDVASFDADAPGSEGLSRVKVLEVPLGHKRLLSWFAIPPLGIHDDRHHCIDYMTIIMYNVNRGITFRRSG